jgi:hypothetical protein
VSRFRKSSETIPLFEDTPKFVSMNFSVTSAEKQQESFSR